MTRHTRSSRMLKSQRILVFIGLLVVAWMLHALLCEWRYGHPLIRVAEEYRIVTFVHQEGASGRGPFLTGLFVAPGVGREVAALFGVVLPAALVGVDAYLLLGWRHAARRRQGRCPQCGYDLQGLPPDRKCPECGWGREEATG